MTTSDNLTPQQRLTNSRQAIVVYMKRDDDSAVTGNASSQPSDGDRSSVWKTLKRSALTWWRHHPAHLALDVATGVAKPVLSKYADEKPIQLLGIAAVLGAAVVLVRPWRLISMTGLLLAAVKSPGLSPALLSLLTPQPEFTNPPEDLSSSG